MCGERARGRARAVAALAAGAIFARAPAAHGQESPAPKPAATSIGVRFEYPDPPPPRCPSASSFRQQVMARSGRIRAAEAGEAAPRLVVHLSRTSGPERDEVTGDLGIKYADGTLAKRALDGESCESVVSGLALMSVMALDPTAVPGSAHAEAAATPPDAATTPAATAPPDGVGAGGTVDLEAGTHLAVGLRGGPVFGMAPDVVLGVAAFVDIARVAGARDLWSPSFRATFDYSTSGETLIASGGAVEIARTTLMVDGCPVRWASGPLRLTPCLHLEAGDLAASGVDVNPAKTSSRPWVSVGGLAAARFVFHDRLFVELSAGLGASLVRDRYYFVPNTTVYQVPAVTGLAAAAVGFTIF